MALIKKMSAPITQLAECVLHTPIWQTGHTCQYGVGGETNSETLAMPADTCEGCTHARTHAPRILPCVINYVSSEQKVNLTCKKASPYKKVQVRQGKTKTMEVKGGEKAAQSEERECKRAKCCSLLTLCYYWQTVSQICSVAVSLRYIELWLL